MYSDRRPWSIDWTTVIARLVKYTLEGLLIAVAAYSIPQGKLDMHEIITIGLVAASTFACADVISPSIASSARMGSGLAIGASLTGFGGRSPKILSR
jgi:hypothetical protein